LETSGNLLLTDPSLELLEGYSFIQTIALVNWFRSWFPEFAAENSLTFNHVYLSMSAEKINKKTSRFFGGHEDVISVEYFFLDNLFSFSCGYSDIEENKITCFGLGAFKRQIISYVVLSIRNITSKNEQKDFAKFINYILKILPDSEEENKEMESWFWKKLEKETLTQHQMKL